MVLLTCCYGVADVLLSGQLQEARERCAMLDGQNKQLGVEAEARNRALELLQVRQKSPTWSK